MTRTVLDYDRLTHRVPADLRRRVEHRDQKCSFPGCGRPAVECDADHTIAWEHGGTTALDNLAMVCRHHHRLKHQTRWKVEQAAGTVQWTSPTGIRRAADPPPY